MTRVRRAWRWIAARPFRASLVVMMCIAVPGYFRQEQIINDQEQVRQERLEDGCRRAVEGRDDNRAMWIYLLETRADPEDPKVQAFVEQLNRRLPALECNAKNEPVPVTD